MTGNRTYQQQTKNQPRFEEYERTINAPATNKDHRPDMNEYKNKTKWMFTVQISKTTTKCTHVQIKKSEKKSNEINLGTKWRKYSFHEDKDKRKNNQIKMYNR